MNLRHLEIYKVVCKHMSITKAAEELYMSQPAVSITIRELEDFYHTKLFDRIGRKIYLTYSGEKLLSYANTILNEFDLALEDLRNQSSTITCNIGVNVSIGEGYLSSFIHYIKSKIPHLKLHIVIDNVEQITQRFKNNEFDFIVIDSPYNASFHYVLEKLHSERIVAVCSKTYIEEDTITLDELVKHPLLLREEGSGSRRLINYMFETLGYHINAYIESISHYILMEYVKDHHGITIIPESLNNDSLKTIYTFDESFTRDYYIMYHDSKDISPITKECILLLKEYFKSLHK